MLSTNFFAFSKILKIVLALSLSTSTKDKSLTLPFSFVKEDPGKLLNIEIRAFYFTRTRINMNKHFLWKSLQHSFHFYDIKYSYLKYLVTQLLDRMEKHYQQTKLTAVFHYSLLPWNIGFAIARYLLLKTWINSFGLKFLHFPFQFELFCKLFMRLGIYVLLLLQLSIVIFR